MGWIPVGCSSLVAGIASAAWESRIAVLRGENPTVYGEEGVTRNSQAGCNLPQASGAQAEIVGRDSQRLSS